VQEGTAAIREVGEQFKQIMQRVDGIKQQMEVLFHSDLSDGEEKGLLISESRFFLWLAGNPLDRIVNDLYMLLPQSFFEPFFHLPGYESRDGGDGISPFDSILEYKVVLYSAVPLFFRQIIEVVYGEYHFCVVSVRVDLLVLVDGMPEIDFRQQFFVMSHLLGVSDDLSVTFNYPVIVFRDEKNKRDVLQL